MPGNYSHASITNGTVLDDVRYNTDHLNHINNMTPAGVDDYSANVAQMQLTTSPWDVGSESLATNTAGELERIRFVIKRLLGTTHWYQGPGLLTPLTIDDYSANVAQMQLTTDPGEVGSESLATTTAGEMERFRFVLKEMKGTAQWYQSAVTKVITVPFVLSTSSMNSGLTPTGTTSVWMPFNVPWDYHSGDVTLQWFYHALASGGVMKRTIVDVRYRDTEAPFSLGTGNRDITISDTNVHMESEAVTAANIAIGDMFLIALTRSGDDAGDTNTDAMRFIGARLSYTGYAGRG
jgi:hypothetical protein